MADKGWTARVATAAGVAAGTGAAQLGLGYGLGVVVWPMTVTQDRSEWLGSLGWATWITASATVFGAVIGSRMGGVPATRSRRAWPLAFAISAGVGALVAVALIALPARSAVRLDAHSPQMIAASYALAGVVLGVLVAYWAVLSRPVAANLIATAAWLWALAITAIIVELSLNRDSATYLTSWQFAEADADVRYGVIYWPSALLTLIAAFAIGIIAVIPAVRRGDHGLGAATSGAVGPLLVAISFLALSPRLTGSPGPIESAYLIAPYGVLAGLAGSALTVALGKAAANRAGSRPSTTPSSGGSPAEDDEPTTEEFPAVVAVPQTSAAQGRQTANGADGAQPAEIAAIPQGPTGDITPETPTHPTGRATLPAQTKPAQTKPAQTKPVHTKPATSPTTADATAGSGMAGGGIAAAPNDGGRRPIADPRPPRPVNDPPKAPAPVAGPPATPRPAAQPAKPDGDRPAVADPEIAAAARPTGRFRGKKAASPPPEPKSTVTPPPAAPTIARINPKSTED